MGSAIKENIRGILASVNGLERIGNTPASMPNAEVIDVTCTDTYSFYSSNKDSELQTINFFYWHNITNGSYWSSSKNANVSIDDYICREEMIRLVNADLSKNLENENYNLVASANAFADISGKINDLIPNVNSSSSLNVYVGFSDGHFGAASTLASEIASAGGNYETPTIYVNINGSYSDDKTDFSSAVTIGQNHIPSIYIGKTAAPLKDFERVIASNGGPVYVIDSAGGHYSGTSGFSATMFANDFLSATVSDTEYNLDVLNDQTVKRYYDSDNCDDLTFEQYQTMVKFDASRVSPNTVVSKFNEEWYETGLYKTMYIDGKYVSNADAGAMFSNAVRDEANEIIEITDNDTSLSTSVINFDIIKNYSTSVLETARKALNTDIKDIDTGASRDINISSGLKAMDGVVDTFSNKVIYEFCSLVQECANVYSTMDENLTGFANTTLNNFLGSSSTGDFTSSFNDLGKTLADEFLSSGDSLLSSLNSSFGNDNFGNVSVDGLNSALNDIEKFVKNQVSGLTSIKSIISEYSEVISLNGMDADLSWAELCRKAGTYVDLCVQGISSFNNYVEAERKAKDLIVNYLSSYGYSSIDYSDLGKLRSEKTGLINLNFRLEESKWIYDYNSKGICIGKHLDIGIVCQIESNKRMIEEISKHIECIEGYPAIEAQSKALEDEAKITFWNSFGESVSTLNVGSGNIEYQPIHLTNSNTFVTKGAIGGSINGDIVEIE